LQGVWQTFLHDFSTKKIHIFVHFVLAIIHIYVYKILMKHSEFKKWLAQQGCTFSTKGKGSHMTVHYGNKKTTMPNHGNKEIGKGLVSAIKKQLGL
jgi:mRNA interferase HicA